MIPITVPYLAADFRANHDTELNRRCLKSPFSTVEIKYQLYSYDICIPFTFIIQHMYIMGMLISFDSK